MSQTQAEDTNDKFKVETSCGVSRGFPRREEAEEGKTTHVSLCDDCSAGDVRILPTGETGEGESQPDAVETHGPVENGSAETIHGPPEVTEAEQAEADREPIESEAEPVPEGKPDLEDDPVDWMPAHFVDHIQGVPTLNRKGYAVMAERFNVSVTSEPVVRASETDFEYAEFQATAKTEDGTEYSGFGSAHVNRKDGDDEYLLNELAETRALKRAASWALGLGMTAKEEMDNSL